VRALFLVIVILAACDKQAPKQPRATGSLVFDIRPGNEADVLLATEAKALRAASADDITVTREPGAMILNVSVHHPDTARAIQLCNAVIRSYVEQRIAKTLMPTQEEQALAEQLDRNPEHRILRDQLAERRLSRTMRRSDVSVLDRCTATRP
jgi:hypothetical protein